MNLPTDIAPPLMALRYAPGQPVGRRDDEDPRGFGNVRAPEGFDAALAATETGASQTEATANGLDDLLDVINPLQHVPGVSSIYRNATGDEISAPARLLGGALFGGPIGLGLALANVITEDITGEDIGEHVIAALAPTAPATGAVALARADAARPGIGSGTETADGTVTDDDDANDGSGKRPDAGTALAQYTHVKDWAETEMRLRDEAARARGIGTQMSERTSDSFVESALLSGAMKSAMKEYDHLAGGQRRDDHMALELDLEG